MKKIAILVPDLMLGGGQRVAISTADLLSVDNEVHIVTLSNENNLFNTKHKIISLDVKKQNSIFGKLLNIAKRVSLYKKLLKKEKYDTTISFLESANLCAFLSDRKTSILTMHNKLEMLAPFDQLMLKHVLKYSNNIVAVSQGLKDELVSTCNLKNVTVIKNPVEPSLIQNLSNEYEFSHPRKFIISAGRLSYQKNFETMIDAYYASNASSEYDLVIAGDGEDYDKLKSKIKPDSNNVHLLGQVSNPFPIIKQSAFYLQSSRTEAFPMAFLEALSLGKPLVAYNCPTGLTELLKHMENGLLVDNNDFDGLVTAINKMTEDKELYKTLSDNALGSVQEFSPANTHTLWMNLFDSILGYSKVGVEQFSK